MSEAVIWNWLSAAGLATNFVWSLSVCVNYESKNAPSWVTWLFASISGGSLVGMLYFVSEAVPQ